MLINRNFLLLEIIKRFISKEGIISDGQNQKERRIIINKFLILFTYYIKHNILKIIVVLYLSLANIINGPLFTA
jgi:hypothetical protein